MQTNQRQIRRLSNLAIGRRRKETWFCIFVSAFCLLLASCSTMSIPEDKVCSTESCQFKTENNKLLVAVHLLTDTTEIDDIFKLNLLDQGILPILIIVENHNPTTSFILVKNKVTVVDRKSLDASTKQGGEVTSETPSHVVSGVGAALLVPAAIIAAPLIFEGMKMESDAQVIEHNLREKEFYSHTVGPGQKVHGYVYFNLPKDNVAMNQYHVLVEAVESTTGETTTFDFPIDHINR